MVDLYLPEGAIAMTTIFGYSPYKTRYDEGVHRDP
jgi:hypothetical protein